MQLIKARVVSHHRGKYRVKAGENEFWAKIPGKMRHEAKNPTDYPVVGDWLQVMEQPNDDALIQEILPRKTLLQRKAINKEEAQVIAANIDVAFIIQAVDRDFNLNRLERYLSLTASDNISSIIVLNKIDLITEGELADKVAQTKERFKETGLLLTSAIYDEGVSPLAKVIEKGKTYCLLGSSGVGKSSIINRLLGKDVVLVKEISQSTNKGRHGTTHRELFELANGGFVIDNPGMREVGIAEADTVIEKAFDLIRELGNRCHFSDCSHSHEANCAVLAAVKAGMIDPGQHRNFVKLKKESDDYAKHKLKKRHKS
ncbi:MAG: ribosome small subunit-dependent GTPase A [bacterium]